MGRISVRSGFAGNSPLGWTIRPSRASQSQMQNWPITRTLIRRNQNPGPLTPGKIMSLDLGATSLNSPQIPGELGESLARYVEDEFGHVRQLILAAKDRGYLLYDEINDSLPADVHSSQEIDDLLSALEHQGIEIYEDIASANAARASASIAESPEPEPKEDLAAGGDLDLSAGVDPQSQDPVRIYL